MPCFSQVTKKLVSAKKNHVTQEFYSAAQIAAKRQADRDQNHQDSPRAEPNQHHHSTITSSCSPDLGAAATPTSQHTAPKQKAPSGSTPSSASKRRHRKLAVTFEAAKVSQ